MGKESSDFDPLIKTSYYYRAPNLCANFHQNEKNCDRRSDHSKTAANDFIICPKLCYSNGTDKNIQTNSSPLQKWSSVYH